MSIFQSSNIPQSSEVLDVLWSELDTRSLRYRFKRSVQLDHRYVVDYYCDELKLVVEVVDTSYALGAEKEQWLLPQGYTLLYFSPTQVSANPKVVVDKVFRVCLHLSSLI